MTARMRRLASDYEEIKKNFAGHKNIIVTPIGGEPPEKYHVTYFVNGIYLLPDGRIETLGRHEVEITLHLPAPPALATTAKTRLFCSRISWSVRIIATLRLMKILPFL